jgi:hypothetical protein
MKPITAIVDELKVRDLLPLVERIATAHRVTVGELLAPCRDSLAVQARHAVWRALAADPEVHWSLARIGKLFGVNHSSVRTALKGRDRRAA